jgi:predicted MFS family arabinose efflux permease
VSTNRHALGLVILAQFGATSTWFSYAAGARSLAAETGWSAGQVGALGTATQLGFAVATLALAWRGTVDRVPLPRLFAAGALPPPGAVIPRLWRTPAFRAAVGAYLGHLWELYPFWALVPLLASSPAIAFAVFAVGALTCGFGGALALRIGPRRLAALAMAASCSAALAYPLAADLAPWLAALALVAWGAAVIPDSPHLSVLAARAAPDGTAGSALALSTSLGFALTALGILGASALLPLLGAKVAWVLAVGPALGLLGLRPRRAG